MSTCIERFISLFIILTLFNVSYWRVMEEMHDEMIVKNLKGQIESGSSKSRKGK